MSIRAIGIRKEFGNPPTQVLKGIDLEVKSGEFVAITGRSGSGKSTLLYVMSSLDQPSGGEVEIDGRKLSSINEVELHRMRNRDLGFIFQFHYLLPELSALENVLMPAQKSGKMESLRAEASELLKRFGLGHRLGHFPSQLSGGEQQRVAIARALIMKPKYLFADEPTGNLDTENGDQVMEILGAINQESSCTILMVTHDPDYAQRAHRRIQLVDGKIDRIW